MYRYLYYVADWHRLKNLKTVHKINEKYIVIVQHIYRQPG